VIDCIIMSRASVRHDARDFTSAWCYVNKTRMVLPSDRSGRVVAIDGLSEPWRNRTSNLLIKSWA